MVFIEKWSNEGYGGAAVLSTDRPLRCREHMICPLPRASEMSAPAGGRWGSMEAGEGLHDLRGHRRGAGDEGAGRDTARDEWGAELAAGGRHSGDAPAQPAALAGAAAAGGV